MAVDVNWQELVAGLVLGAALSRPLEFALHGAFDVLANQNIRRLDGKWETHYWYDDEHGRRHQRDDAIILEQYGVLFRGINEGVTDHTYSMRARLRHDKFLTGVWKSERKGTLYHGALQLVVMNDENSEMRGRWLGLELPNLVYHGEWVWRRIS